MATKWVYMFTEGNATMRNLLGGKGANLAEMTALGLPVPQGFTITTEACTQYYEDGRQINDEIMAQIMEAITKMEDEKCTIPEGKQEVFDALPKEYSHLHLAIDNQLAAVICIEDPLREEASAVVNSLKRAGLSKVVMMTGDSERTAAAIAKKVGVDEYYSEVLPEDKAHYVEKEKEAGRKVIMIGDGINDSPALSAADVGIAISDGAEIAREIADITVGVDDLYQI